MRFLSEFPAPQALDALVLAHGAAPIALACRRLLDGDGPLPRRLGLRIANRPMPPGFDWAGLMSTRLFILPPLERAAALASIAQQISR